MYQLILPRKSKMAPTCYSAQDVAAFVRFGGMVNAAFLDREPYTLWYGSHMAIERHMALNGHVAPLSAMWHELSKAIINNGPWGNINDSVIRYTMTSRRRSEIHVTVTQRSFVLWNAYVRIKNVHKWWTYQVISLSHWVIRHLSLKSLTCAVRSLEAATFSHRTSQVKSSQVAFNKNKWLWQSHEFYKHDKWRWNR